MSDYDGHDSCAREFAPKPAAAVVASIFGALLDLALGGMVLLLAGRWTWLAMGPIRGWEGLFALLVALGVGVFAGVLALVILARTRDADVPLRFGLRFGILLVFLVGFAVPVISTPA
jgi:hypothetical protein